MVRVLAGAEEVEALVFVGMAATVARRALCHRSRCGSVVVAGGEAIGAGRNDPPDGCAMLACRKDFLPAGFKSDRTCCVHAEQNAIMAALLDAPGQVPGSRLYFVRLDGDGQAKRAGKPYCTICSKMALAARVAEFVLWHDAGITVYDTAEYNELSFQFAG